MWQTIQVGQFILQARKMARLKQENLGFSIGCTGSYIHRCEKGKTLPSFPTAVKLEQALKLHRGALVCRIAEAHIDKIIQEANAFGAALLPNRIAHSRLKQFNGSTHQKIS